MNVACVVCGAPAHDVNLCARCESRLVRAVAEIPALADELETTITRQTAQGPQEGGRSAEKPLPVNLTASYVADDLKATLVAWVRDLEPNVTYQPRDDLAAIGRWLLSHMDAIRSHKAVDELHDEISYAVREAWRAVDRPANRSKVLVAGCLDVSCDGSLWALIPTADYDSKDASTHAKIQCDECGITYAAEGWMHLGKRLLAAKRVA